jgi:hypothetical protein
MFHATISTAHSEPFRLSGQVVPYDLQVLREHVLARRARDTRVEVRLAPAEHRTLLAALGDIERRGVVLVLQP